MHGTFNKPADAIASTASLINFRGDERPQKKFADETPAQQARHAEIARRYQQPKRRGSPKMFVRIKELERVFIDLHGMQLPDNSAGRDCVFLMANHLAHRDEPERRIANWAHGWAPWMSADEVGALIERVMRRPYKWTADKLAMRLGIDFANRTRLKLRTIGATDCKKYKRISLRRKNATLRARAKRARAGATPQALSAARTEPWKKFGISPRTYYRRLKEARRGTVGTVSLTACPSDITLGDHLASG
jgi:hypothetical protein